MNKEHSIKEGEVFVFGSNLAGRHGKGAAKTALIYYGAVYGKGEGYQGNSYAIPTKNQNLKTLSLSDIQHCAECFINFAKSFPDMKFFLTRIGCGLAGYKDKDIAPFFKEAPPNVRKPPDWNNE